MRKSKLIGKFVMICSLTDMFNSNSLIHLNLNWSINGNANALLIIKVMRSEFNVIIRVTLSI